MASHLARPGCRRGPTLAHRGILPRRQGVDRARPAPSSALALLAPLDHPGHARPCLPGRGHRHRTPQPTHPDWSDHVDRQRVSPPVRRSAPDHPPHHHQSSGLVTMATTTPIPGPPIPLPTPQKPMTTNYGCSTRAATRWQLETTSRPHPTTRGRLGRRDGVLGLAHRGSSGYAASTHEPERLSVTVADAPAVCLTSPSKTGGSCAHRMTGPSAYRRLAEGFSKPGIFGTAAYR